MRISYVTENKCVLVEYSAERRVVTTPAKPGEYYINITSQLDVIF